MHKQNSMVYQRAGGNSVSGTGSASLNKSGSPNRKRTLNHNNSLKQPPKMFLKDIGEVTFGRGQGANGLISTMNGPTNGVGSDGYI